MNTEYKDKLVDQLIDLDRELKTLAGTDLDEVMAKRGIPKTSTGFDLARKILTELRADVEFKLVNTRYSVELARVAERFHDDVDRALKAHKLAVRERKEAEAKLAGEK